MKKRTRKLFHVAITYPIHIDGKKNKSHRLINYFTFKNTGASCNLSIEDNYLHFISYKNTKVKITNIDELENNEDTETCYYIKLTREAPHILLNQINWYNFQKLSNIKLPWYILKKYNYPHYRNIFKKVYIKDEHCPDCLGTGHSIYFYKQCYEMNRAPLLNDMGYSYYKCDSCKGSGNYSEYLYFSLYNLMPKIKF